MMHCPHCPVAADQTCAGECPGSGAYFCNLATQGEAWERHIRGRSQYPCPDVRLDALGEPAANGMALIETPPLAEFRELQKRVRTCPHRSRPETCGCERGQALCLAGRSPWSDGKVTIRDCIDCLGKCEAAGEPWPPSVAV